VESVEGQGTTFQLWLPEADFTEQERVQEGEERRRRTLLVVGTAGRSLDTTVDSLRRGGFFVVAESRENQALEMLDSLDYEFDAVLVQVAADTSDRIGQLLREVRQRKPPVKSILQIIGKNEDEVHSTWLKDASLTLPSDLQETEFQRQIDELFDTHTSR
jgi:DNA-binding NarL/FixJ family response regulator